MLGQRDSKNLFLIILRCSYVTNSAYFILLYCNRASSKVTSYAEDHSSSEESVDNGIRSKETAKINNSDDQDDDSDKDGSDWDLDSDDASEDESRSTGNSESSDDSKELTVELSDINTKEKKVTENVRKRRGATATKQKNNVSIEAIENISIFNVRRSSYYIFPTNRHHYNDIFYAIVLGED